MNIAAIIAMTKSNPEGALLPASDGGILDSNVASSINILRLVSSDNSKNAANANHKL